jgi:hypothetical protein
MVEEHGNAESGQNLGNVVVVVASLCDRDRSSTRANSPLRPIGWPLSRAQHLSGAPRTPVLFLSTWIQLRRNFRLLQARQRLSHFAI